MKIIINAAIGVAIVLASYAITTFVFNNVEKSIDGTGSSSNRPSVNSGVGTLQTDGNGEQYYLNSDGSKDYIND